MSTLAIPLQPPPPRPTLALPLSAQAPQAQASTSTLTTAPTPSTTTANATTPPLPLVPPVSNARRRSSIPRQSPSDEEADDDDDGDEASGAKKRARKKKGVGTAAVGAQNVNASTNAAANANGVAGVGQGGVKDGGEYKYLAEIGQMMFVFGEVQDPLPETIKLVEDIVRGQVIEMVTRARLLTHLRGSRYLSAEDLIFLIREDRGKVNRLRTYLSWKDVRKRAKEEEEGDVELVDEKALKSRRTMVKLPWELLTPFSDFLKGLPSSQNRAAAEEEDEEDEDEMQAYQDSMQRLRDADEITKKMTKDEYVHYSDCRQASFTYRKAKRFREFINFTAYLDVRPNDDIVDILGFLSFEMVRSLCVTALDVRDRHNNSQHSVPLAPSGMKRRHTGDSIPKRGSPEDSISISISTPPNKNDSEQTIPTSARKNTITSSGGAGGGVNGNTGSGGGGGGGGTTGNGGSHYPLSLFAPPPSARQPLLPAHVLEAFAQIQRQQANIRGSGLRHWRGGVGRSRMALV